MSEKLRREEFPNPREQRGTWQTLNGYWDFRFGEEDAYTRKINVPYQQNLVTYKHSIY